ncbi:MAG: hypothetical protein J6E45_04400 [Prevotella sp.]|nr:hypothetical protein [Prevotella sp.]
MKRKILFAVALLATMTAAAQNIAAVSPSNATTIFQTLDEAIAGAESGSTIYLPGGGFQIKDETKINKKLTIMGVSHRGDTDNVDGATVISGNLHFEEGSSGSAILGIYVSGNINVGTANTPVTNFTVRYCNVNSIQVKNSQSSGMVVNQSYLRSGSSFGDSNAKITNNILHSLVGINNGEIYYNIILNESTTYWGNAYSKPRHTAIGANLSRIRNNVIIEYDRNTNTGGYYYAIEGSNNQITSNMNMGSIGEDCIIIPAGSDWNNVFEHWNNGAISHISKFHFKDKYKQYERQVGIYAGNGFSDEKSLAPIPRIISKKVAESTDESGKLQIIVKVKAQ